MKTYTVHEPVLAVEAGNRGRPDMRDRVDRGDMLVFVPDGFNWTAALFAPLVLLANHIYRGLGVYVVVLATAATVLSLLGAAPGWIVLAAVALHLFVGFEYGELKRSQLDSNGWVSHGPITGRSLDECERRFYSTWLPRQPVMSVETHRPAPQMQRADPPDAPRPQPVSRWRSIFSR